jgi:uncharacterized small protein (DUF1192 family)
MTAKAKEDGLPWSEIQLEATRVLQKCLVPPPPPPHCYHHHHRGKEEEPASAAAVARSDALAQDVAAVTDRIMRLEAQGKALEGRVDRCESLAESSYLAAQDGTRALRLAHRRLLLLEHRRGGGCLGRGQGRRLTLDHLRVLVDTGLIFAGDQLGDGREAEGDGGRDQSGGSVAGLAGVAELVDRVAALEGENRRLVRQQQHLARLLARTVAALEALSEGSPHSADGEEEEEGEGEEATEPLSEGQG